MAYGSDAADDTFAHPSLARLAVSQLKLALTNRGVLNAS